MKNTNSKTFKTGLIGTVAMTLVVSIGVVFSNKVLANSTTPKYQVGSVVRIADYAYSETNGYTLTNRHSWVGTVVSVTRKAYSNSVWVYKIQYPNGWHNDYVAEQDVTNIRNSHYNVGSVVKIANNAYSETNGYTLTNHHKELH
ncbi:hypothetical protein [Leuconostoc pseudomesenteroides]|uniref:hypothetical protein n=1 Tax=Leuconostoc pseudomesenteroides TaxID=33968 RepID=UPI0032DFF43A